MKTASEKYHEAISRLNREQIAFIESDRPMNVEMQDGLFGYARECHRASQAEQGSGLKPIAE